ncbi:MAG: arabinonolactonase, partial [Acidocella sp. 20-61-6]
MAAGPSFNVADPAGALLGEGPVWLAEEGAVYWVDIKSGVLNRYRLEDGAVRRWQVAEHLAWVVPRRDGPGFVAGTRQEIGILRVDALEAVFEPRVAVAEPHPDNRLNDAKADHQGTIWFGTMDNAEQAGTGGFYRLAEDFSFVLADHGYVVANGPTTSPDNQVIYHTDSAARTVYRFTRDGSTGSVV